MFAESLLDSSWTHNVRRGWTTLTSFGVQALAMGLLLLLPLWKTVGLPTVRTVSTPVTLGRLATEPSPSPRSSGSSVAPNNSVTARFVAPGRVPQTIEMTGDEPAAPQPSGPIGDGLDRIGIGDPNGLPLGILRGTRPVLLAAPPPKPTREFRTSNMLEGSVIHRVTPVYPFAAKAAHVQGVVLLAAVISKAGAIENLQVISGHPLLAGVAVDAVKQWRYRPYILNGEAIEVETQIRVSFTLGDN